MNKKITLSVLSVILISTIFYFSFLKEKAEAPSVTDKHISDVKNTTYIIENTPVTLKDGVAETHIPLDSASKTITRYFGNEAKADLNGDGKEDVALIITQESGGSGLFYYVALLIGDKEGYKTTNAVFLGDRIAPQTTEIHDGKIYVNFAERKQNEPMTASPSIGKTITFKVEEDGRLTSL